MKTRYSKSSIYKVLFLEIVVTIILLNSILAIINIRDAIKIQQQSEENLRNKIRDEIIGLSDFQTSALQTFEKSFYDLQRSVLEKIVSEGKTVDLKTENLTNKLRSFGLDTTFHNLYIIEYHVIINTTYLPDWGLDFSAFGQERIDLLDYIQKSKAFFAEKFQFESSTKRLRSYSYQATSDGEYIIEIGSCSEVADRIMNMLKNRLKQISDENEQIVSVNYWFGNEVYQIAIIDEPINRYIPDSTKEQSFIQKKDMTADFDVRDQKMNIEFMYFKQDPSTRLPDFALSVITDNTNRMEPVYKIIQRQVFFTALFLILIIEIVYLSTRKLKE